LETNADDTAAGVMRGRLGAWELSEVKRAKQQKSKQNKVEAEEMTISIESEWTKQETALPRDPRCC